MFDWRLCNSGTFGDVLFAANDLIAAYAVCDRYPAGRDGRLARHRAYADWVEYVTPDHAKIWDDKPQYPTAGRALPDPS